MPLALTAPGTAAWAQQATPPDPVSVLAAADPQDDSDTDADAPASGREILVIGTRLKGQVSAPQAPIATLNAADIAAYGATSIADLLVAIAPQTGSGRGRSSGGPVLLVNGQRIASHREMRDYPPEAIRRVEILPEEVALRYGYAPDQRVINFILRDNFRSRTAEAEYDSPERGGTATGQISGSLLKINGQRRFNVALKADSTSLLTEAERGVAQAAAGVAGDPDPAAARSLVASARNYSANATLTLPLGTTPEAGNVALNASASRADSTGLSGLTNAVLTAPGGASVLRTWPGALTRQNRVDTLQAGASLNTRLEDWQFSATLDASHAETTLDTAVRGDTAAVVAAALAGSLPIGGALPGLATAGFARSQSTTNTATGLATLIGSPLLLPAGKLMVTARLGFAYGGLSAHSAAGGANSLARGDLSVGVNVAVPITSRRQDVGAALGDVTLNLSAGGNRLSDMGRLGNWSAGLTWGLTEKLNLQASYIYAEAAPTLGQLGNPQSQTFNLPVYDPATGQTVLVTATGGGNAALGRETRRDIKLGVTWNLPFLANSNLIAEYFSNQSRNVATSFPLLSPEVEAAFAGRVMRDGAGRILALDQRPVTLAQQNQSRLRWGVNLNGNLGKKVPMGMGMGRGGFGGGGRVAGAPSAMPPRGGPGAFGGRDRHEGRWNFALYHTVQLTNRALLAPGTALLDVLNGDALASSGGVARHALELDAGAFYKGFGLRLGGNWTGTSHARAAGSDLRFGAVFKVKARAFVDLGQQQRLVKAAPFFKRARLAFTVENLFDQRQRVTDAAGRVPLAYQPDYIDPLGRVFGVEFRKMF